MKFLVLPCRQYHLNKPVTEPLSEKEGHGNSGAEKGVGYADLPCLPDTCAMWVCASKHT